MSGFREECGVVGVYGRPEAANLVYLGLYALQHRGQEGAGIASSSPEGIISHRDLGLVADVFDEEIIRRLDGTAAIGHNRYSTSGQTVLRNTQPFVVEYSLGSLALAHNGNFVNADVLHEQLERRGSIFQSTVDSEVLVHLIAASTRPTLLERTIDALAQVQGAYSVLFLSQDELIAARDPHGFRPLVLGEFAGGGYVVASETCALDLMEARYVREVEPGEILHFTGGEVHSLRPFASAPRHACIFEYIYFARPDSIVFGRNVYEVRKAMGRQLAREAPADADVVVPVPDSGLPAALGYAEESGIPFDMGLIRNHYVGRTFIEPTESIRHFGVKIKLNAQRDVLAGKRVVVVDDSIVRGTTSRKIVGMIRAAGAREIHFRVCAPPTVGPCYYGVDTPTHEELIANRYSVEEIGRWIGADTLAYLSTEGLMAFAGGSREGFCDACFTNDYPVGRRASQEHWQMKLFEALEMAPRRRRGAKV
ncbi:MAG: amidophosphoribosyltransferase [Candidatus Dadabacteria bacterium]|nr:MAG: amidophosphoribosyltransferase [Candidatus Dadabacteria bacterium]